jgi:hypothetical protein
MVAGFSSEWWPASNRNPGRHHFGIPGRNASESALKTVLPESPIKLFAKKEQILADNTRERIQAEAQFKKMQKQKEGAEAMAAYVADGHAVRAKTARLRELRLAKEAADKAVRNKPIEKAKKRAT